MRTADTPPLRGSALAIALEAAVPLHTLEIARLSPADRTRVAAQAGRAVASQGDTLMFGSRYGSGHGTRQEREHAARARRPGGCRDPGCWCRMKGQPDYSAGEVFTFLARGLACAAFQPGGITFAGLHWCADHGQCEAARAAARTGPSEGAAA